MRKIKNKKGFTLVELIVVIAILAVLAAIIIPTLLSYTVRSHVSNANTTAGKLRDNVTYFLTQADAEGYGMFMSTSAVCDVKISVDDGKWTVDTTDPQVFVQHYTTKWMGNGVGWIDDGNGGSARAETRLASYLASTFREMKTAYIELRLVGGVCTALYYVPDHTATVANIPTFGSDGGWSADFFAWDESNQGVTEDGVIVGTSPLLPMSM